PMSTLYGSDAMGGVINIITRKVAKEWGGSVTTSYLLQQHSKAGDEKTASIAVHGPLIEDTVGLSLLSDVKRRDASDLYLNHCSKLTKRCPSPMEVRVHIIDTKLSYPPTENQDFTLDVDSAKQKYNNDACQLGT